MTSIIDTNILVRAAAMDDPRESPLAVECLLSGPVVIPTHGFCEFVWVLRSLYKLDRLQIAKAVRSLIAIEGVVFDRQAVEAGLAFLENGGDFADGVIALEGRRLGGKTFVTFDRKAAAILSKLEYGVRLLTPN